MATPVRLMDAPKKRAPRGMKLPAGGPSLVGAVVRLMGMAMMYGPGTKVRL
jgi:hypothetical protein